MSHEQLKNNKCSCQIFFQARHFQIPISLMKLLSFSSSVEYFSKKLSKEWNICIFVSKYEGSMLKSFENNVSGTLKRNLKDK